MTTPLGKALKRLVTIGDAEYVVTIDPDGLRLTGKGRRRPEAALRWEDLLSGEAALAVALQASLATRSAPVAEAPAAEPPVTAPQSRKR